MPWLPGLDGGERSRWDASLQPGPDARPLETSLPRPGRSAFGTAMTINPVRSLAPPHMRRVVRALPPDRPLGRGEHLGWFQIAVQARVPLGSQLRMGRGHAVRTAQSTVSTGRAPGPVVEPVPDRRIPHMINSSITLPPHPTMLTRRHITRPKITVSDRMPLPSKLRARTQQRHRHHLNPNFRRRRFSGPKADLWAMRQRDPVLPRAVQCRALRELQGAGPGLLLGRCRVR